MKGPRADVSRSVCARAIEWIAAGLGLPEQRTRLDWLVRIVFVPPRAGRPDLPQRWVRAAFLALARHWGVIDAHSVRSTTAAAMIGLM